MSYPNSAVVFGTKNAGDTIQPAHVNDLQTEVAAIEQALITGPITLPASTLASLSVTAGSTFAGAVSFGAGVASTVSFASSVTFTDVTITGTLTATIPSQSPTALVTHSVDQNTNSAAWTGPNWDTEVVDAPGMHSTSANSSRITCVHSTGLYMVGANVNWLANSNGARVIRIMCNDSSAVAANKVEQHGASPIGASVSGLARVASTADYFTVLVFQNSGSTLSVTNSTTYANSFWAHKVST